MKKACLLLGLTICVFSITAFAGDGTDKELESLGFAIEAKAGNSPSGGIRSIETRDSGFQAVYLTAAVPDESCDLADRAIIVSTTDAGRAMFDTAMMALVHAKAVIVRVDGCVSIAPETSLTAPRVIKVQIFR